MTFTYHWTKDIQLHRKIIDAYRFKKMTITEIALAMEDKLGGFATAKYRVARVLQDNDIEVDPQPHKKMFD